MMESRERVYLDGVGGNKRQRGEEWEFGPRAYVASARGILPHEQTASASARERSAEGRMSRVESHKMRQMATMAKR